MRAERSLIVIGRVIAVATPALLIAAIAVSVVLGR
jgi:hypothetical protein